MINLKKFFNGFVFAFCGICLGTKGRNMKIHLSVAVLVIILGLIVSLSLIEWFIVLLLCALVISAELMNSAIEDLADVVRDHDQMNYQATKDARDLAAGGVLVLAITSAIIGFLIFMPKLLNIFLG